MGIEARGVALGIIFVIFIGTIIGSVLPESGNVLQHLLGNHKQAHAFNIVFLIIGILGVGVALYLGYRSCGL
jgi:hypothetical protein